MSDLKLDTDGDLLVDNSDLVLNSQVDAVSQYLRARLRTFLGEWFLDQSIGIPYFKEIFKKEINIATVDAILKDAILSTPNVIELQEFDFDISNNRELKLNFKIKVKEGNIAFSEVLP